MYTSDIPETRAFDELEDLVMHIPVRFFYDLLSVPLSPMRTSR